MISNGKISFDDNIEFVQPGTTDHIYVAAYDAVDNAKASADIYVTFHPMFDNWVEQNIVEHPGPFQDTGKPGTANFQKILYLDNENGWNFLCYCNQSGATSSLVAATSYSETDSGSISGSTDLDDVNLAFSDNESLTVGKTVTYTVTQNISSAPYSAAAFYIAVTSTDKAGVCAVWGPDGFTGFVAHQSTAYTGVLSTAVDPTNP